MHHFPPQVVDYYKSFDKSSSNFPTTVPLSVGRRAYDNSLLNEDKTKYMTVPNYSMDSVRSDLRRLQSAHGIEVGYRPSPNESSLSNSLGKRSSAQSAHGIIVSAEDVDSHNEMVVDSMIEQHAEELVHMQSQGICRSNLMSKAWHMRFPNAARHYFGFNSFSETVYYCNALFDTTIEPITNPNYDSRYLPTNLDQLEKMLAVKMLIQRDFTNEHIANLWGVSTAVVTTYLKLYMPLWGEGGEDMSTLDMNKSFIDNDKSNKYVGELHSVSCLDDGKIIMTDTFRQNSMFTQAQFSNKVHHPGLLFITWTTPGGLAFESTPLVLGRSSESANVKLWGEHLAFTPCRDQNTRELSLCTAYCFQKDGVNVLDMGTVVASVDERVVGVGHDETTITEDMHDFLRLLEDAEGEVKSDTDSDEDKSDDEDEIVGDCNEMWAWYTSHGSNHQKSRLSNVQHTKKRIEDACDALVKGGPDGSASRKIKQLKRHERLHQMYSNGRIGPCHFSYYLHEFKVQRQTMLNQLLAVEIGVTQLPTRLAKIPLGSKVLSDRGFAEDAPLYPNFNQHITPAFLSGRLQFDAEDVLGGHEASGRPGDKDVKELRYTSEVFFARVTATTILKDSVPFRRLNIIDDAVKWALGSANLCAPLRPSEYYDAYVTTLIARS
jgi:hypothetical protein